MNRSNLGLKIRLAWSLETKKRFQEENKVAQQKLIENWTEIDQLKKQNLELQQKIDKL